MTEPIAEAEAYIQFRLERLASQNEHHRFEEIATRIARKRISSNILLANGPVSAGGDQSRDAESYMTRIPAELPFAAGFSASASTEPVVVACTVQKQGLKAKVEQDVDGICRAGADPVSHIAYFSVHPIPVAATHDLKATVRAKYSVSLDVFSGADLATLLAEPDLVWVARQYLDLPTAMVPPPEDEPAPPWYVELLAKLRQNGGPAALTPATQAEVTQGLRHATWDVLTNSDLPEWLDFMAVFLADRRDGKDTDLAFRACYEISVARFRGTGAAAGVEELIRRAVAFACASEDPNVVDDAVTLASYWGVMWMTGVGDAEAQEILRAVLQLRDRAVDLLAATDSSTHPVRAASLNGTLALLHLLPDWGRVEAARGRPPRTKVAPHAGRKFDGTEIDVSRLSEVDLIGASVAMKYLDDLVSLLPAARVYSASSIMGVFNFMTPVLVGHSSYRRIRDGLDSATAGAEGEATRAAHCRDRGSALVNAGKTLLGLRELHDAKVGWFSGDTLYGTVLTMRSIAAIYSELRLSFAAKMYACTAAALALAHGDDELKEQGPRALLEAAVYAQRSGAWIDGARLASVALLARAVHMAEPFDLDEHPDLSHLYTNSLLELSLIRKLWPDLESLLEQAHADTPEWYADMSRMVEGAGENPMTEAEFADAAEIELTGPVFGDIGADRVVDFEALGVRWVFTFANDRAVVLSSEALVAAFQVFLADVATLEPVVFATAVHTRIYVEETNPSCEAVVVDRDGSDAVVRIALCSDPTEREAQHEVFVAACFELLGAVFARPVAELTRIVESAFEAGLMHKLFIGRPYEEVVDFLGDAHYLRCSAVRRPEVSDRYRPTAPPPLAASTVTGAGYDSGRSLALIRERYEVGCTALRYTLPRLLAKSTFRRLLERLREEGWLDWQILVALVNVAWNVRMRNAGMVPGVGDRALAMRLAREPETPASIRMPLEEFVEEAVRQHLELETHSVANRWELSASTRGVKEGLMRDLLIRRYHFAEDDVPHSDLLGDVVVDGVLQDLV